MAFCLSLNGSSVNVVTVGQCLLSDNRFTERDPWRARGSREGLGLAGVRGREKSGKGEHVERREVGRDTAFEHAKDRSGLVFNLA